MVPLIHRSAYYVPLHFFFNDDQKPNPYRLGVVVVVVPFPSFRSASSLLSQRPVSHHRYPVPVTVIPSLSRPRSPSVPFTVHILLLPNPVSTRRLFRLPNSGSSLFSVSIEVDVLDESATCLGGFYVTSRASRSASTPASDSHPIHSFCSCSQCKIRPRLCCRITAPPCRECYELSDMNYPIWIMRNGLSEYAK